MRVTGRRVLTVVPEGRIRPACVAIHRWVARRDILIDGCNQVQSAQMLISDAQRGALAQLVLHFDASLFGVSVLNLTIHSAKVYSRHGRRYVRQNVRKYGRCWLSWRQADGDLAELT